MRLRDATTADAGLLAELLLEAYNWTGEVRMTREAMLADAHALRYLEGWRRPGDLGLVMVDDGPPAVGTAESSADTSVDTSTDTRVAGAAFDSVPVSAHDEVVGAIWARLLPASAPGYGYVADDIPELSMAVRRERRGRGVGAALLAGLVEQGRAARWRGLSLSVEDGNDAARRLYERFGFRVVGRSGGSDTMLLDLEVAG